MHTHDTSDIDTPATIGWRAAILGGGFAIGAICVGGTAISNAYKWIAIAHGLSAQQAWAAMWADTNAVSAYALMGCGANFASSFAGGLVSAELGRGRPWKQGLAAGLLVDLFILTMQLSPDSPPTPALSILLAYALPPVAALAGGMACAKLGPRSA